MASSASSSMTQKQSQIGLVARPPLHPASYDKVDASRFNEIFLYYSETPPQEQQQQPVTLKEEYNSEKNTSTTTKTTKTTTTKTTNVIDRNASGDYRYRLTVVDHPLFAHTTTTKTTTSTSMAKKKGMATNTKTTTTIAPMSPPTQQQQQQQLQCATAVFLIPAGRESEYMFRTQRGLQQVCQSAKAGRLIAVALGRTYNDYHNTTTVQHELTWVVQLLGRQGQFLPLSWRQALGIDMSAQQEQQQTIPFMALDGIGQRKVLVQGETAFSGSYLVEQVRVDGGNDKERVRRLYFTSNPFVIQSQVVCKQRPKSNNNIATKNKSFGQDKDDDDDDKDDWMVDPSQVAFEYHRIIAAGLLALCRPPNPRHSESTTRTTNKPQPPRPQQQQQPRGLIVGLGGGGLVNYLHFLCGGRPSPSSSSSMSLTAVELDPVIAQVACDYFGVQAQRIVSSTTTTTTTGGGGKEGIIQSCKDNGEEEKHGLVIQVGDGLSIQVEEEQQKEKMNVVDLDEKNKDNNDKTTTTTTRATHDTMLLKYPPGHFSFIVVDVDSKDSTVGMSCPPIAFIQLDYLKRLSKLLASSSISAKNDNDDSNNNKKDEMLLEEEPPPQESVTTATSWGTATTRQAGILAMNVAARDPAMFQLVCDNISKVFPCMVIADPKLHKKEEYNNEGEEEDNKYDDEDVNVVIFASDFDITSLSIANVKQRLHQSLEHLEDDENGETRELKADLEQSLLDAISRPTKSLLAATQPNSANLNNNNNNKKKGGQNNKKQRSKKKGKKK